jgi:peptide/nickel transport system substrate-binding protein/oligopeptide transport system substrate-binding protein
MFSRISAATVNTFSWTLCRVSLCLLVLLLCACASSPDPTALRSYLESEPSTFDPALAVDYASGRICALLYDGLMRPGEGLEVEGNLAKSWRVSQDGRRYTFVLKRARFSDGTRITAADVKFSLERLLDPGVGSPRGWIVSAVSGAGAFRSGADGELGGITAKSDTTLSILLDKPFPPFLSMLAMPSAGVVPAAWAKTAEPDDWRSPVCSGPWALESWSEGGSIVLSRNPHYRRTPALERVVLRVLPERMTQVAEFEVGNLDHMSVPKAEMERWAKDEIWGPRLEHHVELAVTYIGLNCQKAPLDDPVVRRALNHAVDKHAVVGGLMKGVAVPSTGAVPPGLPGADKTRGPFQYDVRLAKELLAEAGYPDGFPMEIWYRDGGGAEQVLEAIQAYLKDAGVRVSLQAREWGTLKEAVNRGVPDAYYLDWYADYPDAENFLFPLFHTSNWGGGGNRARFSDPTVDSLLETAGYESNPERRYELYRRIDEIVYGEAPWIYLWHPVRVELRQPWLDGPVVHPLFYGERYLTLSKTRGGRYAG